jgi:hypothetical protein
LKSKIDSLTMHGVSGLLAARQCNIVDPPTGSGYTAESVGVSVTRFKLLWCRADFVNRLVEHYETSPKLSDEFRQQNKSELKQKVGVDCKAKGAADPG